MILYIIILNEYTYKSLFFSLTRVFTNLRADGNKNINKMVDNLIYKN